MKPETPNASHATPHFWREMQRETHQARQVEASRPLATSSLAVGRFAAKQGSPRSPRGRLVASLEANVLWPLFVKTTAFANVKKFFKFFMFYGSEEVFISVQR